MQSVRDAGGNGPRGHPGPSPTGEPVDRRHPEHDQEMQGEAEGGAGRAAGEGGLALDSRGHRLKDPGCGSPAVQPPEDDRIDDVEQARGEAATHDDVDGARLHQDTLPGTRVGRLSSTPPQFGHLPPRFDWAQAAQNVHSKEQMTASATSAGRSRPHRSQFGRISSISASCGRTTAAAHRRRSLRPRPTSGFRRSPCP